MTKEEEILWDKIEMAVSYFRREMIKKYGDDIQVHDDNPFDMINSIFIVYDKKGKVLEKTDVIPIYDRYIRDMKINTILG